MGGGFSSGSLVLKEVTPSMVGRTWKVLIISYATMCCAFSPTCTFSTAQDLQLEKVPRSHSYSKHPAESCLLDLSGPPWTLVLGIPTIMVSKRQEVGRTTTTTTSKWTNKQTSPPWAPPHVVTEARKIGHCNFYSIMLCGKGRKLRPFCGPHTQRHHVSRASFFRCRVSFFRLSLLKAVTT